MNTRQQLQLQQQRSHSRGKFPQRASPRGSPPTLDNSGAASSAAAGHIIQISRSSSQSHGISRNARSRSRGKQRQQQQQQQQSGRRTPQDFMNNSGGFSESDIHYSQQRNNIQRSLSMGNINIHEGKINEHGRCIRHPNIELCCRSNTNSQWRVLLQDCPLCSLDLDTHNSSAAGGNNNLASLQQIQQFDSNHNNNMDGGMTVSSKASQVPSIKTNRTVTTEDVSDSTADSSENEGGNNRVAVQRRRNPPPPPPKQNSSSNMMGNQYLQQNATYQQQQQHIQQSQNQNNPIQSLKELGRKLVMESETSANVGSGAVVVGNEILLASSSTSYTSRNNSTRAPPPPPPPPRGMGMGQQQLLQSSQHQHRPPPRRRGRSRGEEYDTSFNQMSLENSSRSLKGRAEEKVTQLIAEQEQRLVRHQPQQQHQEGGDRQTFTIPMNDAAPSPISRGREIVARGGGGENDDILQAAAQVRARARRSTSRSRERIKHAALFCGENVDDDDETDINIDGGQLLLENGSQEHHLHQQQQVQQSTTQRTKSILNPHGLENQPRPPVMERRSQSHERRRRSSGSRGGKHNRRNRDVGSSGERMIIPQQQTSAEELLSRRREMKQQLVQRQSDVQSRREKMRERRRDSNSGVNAYLSDDDTSRRRRTPRTRSSISVSEDNKSVRSTSTRRGRSRSAVRDGLSKMRSASLNFRNKKEFGVDLDSSSSVDTGKKSTGSSTIKRLLSKSGKGKKPRSLSSGRGITHDWGGKSDTFIDTQGFGDSMTLSIAKSESFARTSPSSRLRTLRKSLTKKKSFRGDNDGGIPNFDDVQSASTFTDNHSEMMFPLSAWEMATSASSGERQQSGSDFLDF